MATPFTPLSEAEFNELDHFLLYDVDTEDVMTLDMVDGFLHAIAVGPTTIQPKRWLPKIWGTKEMMPPMDSIEQLNHMLGLVMRHFNSIIAGLEEEPSEISPYWSTMTYAGDEQEYDDAEMWAYGFIEGMRLCWNDWKPLLSTPQGQAWFRPIALLGRRVLRGSGRAHQDACHEGQAGTADPTSCPGHACPLATAETRCL